MSDNGFQFNWRGMTREPRYPYGQQQPQDGSDQEMASERANYIAAQSANMQGYRPLSVMAGMDGYQPTLSGRETSPESNPMTQPEMASGQEEGRGRMLQELEKNKQRIEELKQEYATLQQEQAASVEDLEYDIAANRAGIGDTTQYNTWRTRVEAREASKDARKADDEYIKNTTLRRAKEAVRNASLALSVASGTYDKAIAKQVYESAVGDYNDLAEKYGLPLMQTIGGSGQENSGATKINTPSDVNAYLREHTDKDGNWDSRESIDEASRMAETLNGEEREKIMQQLKTAVTQAEAKAKKAAARAAANARKAKWRKDAKRAVAPLLDKEKVQTGEYPVTIQEKEYTVKITANANDDGYDAYIDGKLIDSMKW